MLSSQPYHYSKGRLMFGFLGVFVLTSYLPLLIVVTAQSSGTSSSINNINSNWYSSTTLDQVAKEAYNKEENTNTTTVAGCQSLTITLQAGVLSLPNTNNLRITTRLFNGTYPGQPIYMRPGECWRVHFHNLLHDDTTKTTLFRNNVPSAPNQSNIHFHGLHISGEMPSDDVVNVVVKPGGDHYTYTLRVPANHMPGTHWLHTHRHGSTSLQVGGGAVAAVIVQDPPGYLPPNLQDIPQVVFLAHALDPAELHTIATLSGDALFQMSGSISWSEMIITVNGQVLPSINMQPYQWTRFRIIWAAWRKGNLDWTIANKSDGACEMQLLAKDGVYIRDFPRSITNAPLVPGGRADVLVKCQRPSTTLVVTGPQGMPLAHLVVGDSTIDESSTTNTSSLEHWTPDFPDYLQDLQDTKASPGCSCTTLLHRRFINGQTYTPDTILHHSYLGAVVERHLQTGPHPYHQHVYPFQIIHGFDDNDDDSFYLPGDWHDSVMGQGIVRYRPTDITGKIMVHCHRLKHEDEGMMAMEWVHENETAHHGCACTSAALPSFGMSILVGTMIVMGWSLVG